MDPKKISEYYDTILPFYRIYFGSSYGFHTGYYKQWTKSKKEAILNVNQFLAEKASINEGDLILDAGCGIGGSCIWLTENYNVKTIGVTNSKMQLKAAKTLAKKLNISKKVKYYLMDYVKTDFEDNTFDIVWAIESVSVAQNKYNFLKEAHRILKKNGRIIVADGFLKRAPRTSAEKKLLKEFYEGLVLDNIATKQSFEKDLKKANFRNIRYWEKTNEILPWINSSHKLLIPLALLAEKLKITPKSLTGTLKAGVSIRDGVRNGLFRHGVFYAEKKHRLLQS